MNDYKLQTKAEELTDDIKKEIYELLINNIELEKETPFATVSLIMVNNGYPKERFGFSQMKELIKKLEYFTSESREINGVPQIILTMHKMKEYNIEPKEINEETPNTSINNKNFNTPKPKDDLFNFACFFKFNESIEELADLAMDENWGDSNFILKNYIVYTFYRLHLEEKICFSNDEEREYAAFNTGLVDKRYKNIIALFKKNSSANASQPYIFKSFCIAGTNGYGKIISNKFDIKKLQKASYFASFDELFFDFDKPYVINYDHIIIDNIDRLPVNFIEKYVFKNDDIKNAIAEIKISDDPDRTKELYDNIKKHLKDDIKVLTDIETQINAAIDLSCHQKIQQNYRLALPSYYPQHNELNFLIPLSLEDKFGDADVALVVSLTDSGNYQGQTILTMDMAYIDARLLCRFESEWLNPNKF